MSALGYYSAGKDYVEAAKVIWLRSPERQHLGLGKFFLPMHMLLGFSLELFLKAWLRDTGLSSQILRRDPYGHDLQELYAEALRRDFPAVPSQADLVEHLAVEHGEYGYRYMKEGHTYTLTNLPLAFGVLEAINLQVDNRIGASAGYGLPPGH